MAYDTCGEDCISIDFTAFHQFWEDVVNIALLTSIPASKHGYGMNIIKDNASTALLTDAVSNFSMALAATQETLRTNNATITVMQIQPQMIFQTLGSQLPPGMAS